MATKKQQVSALPPDWQQRFKASSIRVGFQLNLSRSMLEFLCAVADDVRWDRGIFGDIHFPDNWITTEASLEKRGLIERKGDKDREAAGEHNSKEITRVAKECGRDWSQADYRNYCQLTPAGNAVVELLKISGLFIECDASTRRRRTA